MDLWASLRPSASSFHLISLKSTGRLTRLSAQWSRWTMDPTSDPRFQVCAGVTFDWGLWTLYFWVCMEIFFSCIFSIFGNIFVICAYPFYRRGALKSYLKGFKNKCLVFFSVPIRVFLFGVYKQLRRWSFCPYVSVFVFGTDFCHCNLMACLTHCL